MGIQAVESTGCVRFITLGERADNKLSMHGVLALSDALARPPTDRERCIVIRSSREDFCLGRAQDPRSPSSPPSPPTSLMIRDRVAGPILELYRAISTCSMPVVAAVQGRAFGLGCAIAGAADVTYASHDASFCLPELNQGVPPTLAISALLGRVPRKALTELVLSRRVIDAAEACGVGLVSRIVQNPQDEASALGAALSDTPMRALATIKSYLALTADAGAPNARALAGEMIASAIIENA